MLNLSVILGQRIYDYGVLKVRGNVNQLRDRYVDVFGLKDEDTSQLWWVYRDTFTGGVTPAASPSDKPYSLLSNTKINYKQLLVHIRCTKVINQY